MKRFKITALVLALLFGGISTAALAQDCPHAQCAKADCTKGGCDKSDCPLKSKNKSVKDKFFKKVKMIYTYQEELGITDEQLNKVKDLKIALKKDHIQKDAEIELIKIDIQSLLYADKVDVDAVNKLVDKKYDIKKAKSKKCIASYAALKSILTAEQMAKMKAMHNSEKKQAACKYSPKGSMK